MMQCELPMRDALQVVVVRVLRHATVQQRPRQVLQFAISLSVFGFTQL